MVGRFRSAGRLKMLLHHSGFQNVSQAVAYRPVRPPLPICSGATHGVRTNRVDLFKAMGADIAAYKQAGGQGQQFHDVYDKVAAIADIELVLTFVLSIGLVSDSVMWPALVEGLLVGTMAFGPTALDAMETILVQEVRIF